MSNYRHGMKHSAEYRSWECMKQRALNPNYAEAHRYSGRGITLDPSWMLFERFYADVGPQPSPRHTLERIDNNKGYEPGNVRWATKAEQARNRRSNILVLVRGVRMVLLDAAPLLGVKYGTLTKRYRKLKARGMVSLPIDVAMLLSPEERAFADTVRRQID